MRASCYIIYSENLKRFYIGVSTGSLEDRIQKHNKAEYGKHRYTSSANDWTLFISVEVDDYSHAVRLERKIKSMKSSKYIQNLKKYPELLEKITLETKSI